LELNLLLFVRDQYLTAFSSHALVGCFFGSVWIRVNFLLAMIPTGSLGPRLLIGPHIRFADGRLGTRLLDLMT
jgi:hypothetical protein